MQVKTIRQLLLKTGENKNSDDMISLIQNAMIS